MTDTIRDFYYRCIDKLYESDLLRDVIGILYLPVTMLYLELIAKRKIFGEVFDDKFKYMLFLTLAMGFLFSLIAIVLPGRARRAFYKVTLAVLAVWFSFHVSYQGNFQTFFSWQTLGQAKDITQFWREAIVATLHVWYLVLLFFLPLVLMCLVGRIVVPDDSEKSNPFAAICLTAFFVLYLPILVVINKSKDASGDYTPYYYYTYIQNDLDSTFHYYGIINTTRLDVKQLIFGAPEEDVNMDDILVPEEPAEENEEQQESEEPEKEYGQNVWNIDFDKAAKNTQNSTLKKMDKYFKSVPPTKKNPYTGLFEGKNLIFITLEGFSDKVIDPEFTPVLYKMASEGFVFKNSYNCAWGGSTASGEYSNITGNFYTTANCLEASASKYQPLVLGNQFKKLGYRTVGYHNNSYTYYGRNKSHPNFGYKWKGVGNGLKLSFNGWPRSDKEMAEVTVGEYMGKNQPFHVYYMSVSGHANYSFNGNMMSTRHRKDLPEKFKSYPSDVQAFLACQYEVELMLQVLVQKLEETGELENTVFAMAADHYPYALSDDGLAALYNLPKSGIRGNPEVYKNQFIVWCASMKEPVVVDTPCSTIDILPTLSNLFGLSYDSRLLMGSDILADGEHFALLKINGWSWVSSQGTYLAGDKRFTPNENCTLSGEEQADHVKRINAVIKGKTIYSKQILDKDYYKHICKFITEDKKEDASDTQTTAADKTSSSKTTGTTKKQ